MLKQIAIYFSILLMSASLLQCVTDRENRIIPLILNNQSDILNSQGTQNENAKSISSPFAILFESAIKTAYENLDNTMILATQGESFLLHEPKLVYTQEQLYPIYHLYSTQLRSDKTALRVAEKFSANIKTDLEEIASHGLFKIYAKKTKITSKEDLEDLIHFVGSTQHLNDLFVPILGNLAAYKDSSPQSATPNLVADEHFQDLLDKTQAYEFDDVAALNLQSKRADSFIEHSNIFSRKSQKLTNLDHPSSNDIEAQINMLKLEQNAVKQRLNTIKQFKQLKTHPVLTSPKFISQIAKLTFYTHIVAIEDNLIYLYKKPIILADDAKTFSTSNLIELTPQNLAHVHSIEDIIKPRTWNKKKIINDKLKYIQNKANQLHLYFQDYKAYINTINNTPRDFLFITEMKMIGQKRLFFLRESKKLFKEINALKSLYNKWLYIYQYPEKLKQIKKTLIKIVKTDLRKIERILKKRKINPIILSVLHKIRPVERKAFSKELDILFKKITLSIPPNIPHNAPDTMITHILNNHMRPLIKKAESKIQEMKRIHSYVDDIVKTNPITVQSSNNLINKKKILNQFLEPLYEEEILNSIKKNQRIILISKLNKVKRMHHKINQILLEERNKN